jgi:hypothetical protein
VAKKELILDVLYFALNSSKILLENAMMNNKFKETKNIELENRLRNDILSYEKRIKELNNEDNS